MISLGHRRECFFDDYLIDTAKTTAEFRLHEPVRRECVMVHNAPWEGDGCDFHNIVKDGNLYRMYYLGWWMLEKGSGTIQSLFNISTSAADVFQGIILFFVLGSEFFINFRVIIGKGGVKNER